MSEENGRQRGKKAGDLICSNDPGKGLGHDNGGVEPRILLLPLGPLLLHALLLDWLLRGPACSGAPAGVGLLMLQPQSKVFISLSSLQRG